MKLKSFNPDNTKTVRRGAPTISFNSKTGIVMLNKPTLDLLDVSVDSQVVFHQDEEDAENWYVEKVSEGGFPLRGKEGEGIYTNSVTLVRQIFESIEHDGPSGTALVAGEATKIGKRVLFGIITARIKTR